MMMSNDAEHLEALLAEYVDGQLDVASAKLVEDHLAKNPAIRAAVEQMTLDRAALQSLPRVNAPADLSEDLRGRLERDLLLNSSEPIGAARSPRFSISVAAIAAMVTIGLGLTGIAYVLLGNRPKPFPEVAIQDTSTQKSPEAASTGDEKSKGSAIASRTLSMTRSNAPHDEPNPIPPPEELVAKREAPVVAADAADRDVMSNGIVLPAPAAAVPGSLGAGAGPSGGAAKPAEGASKVAAAPVEPALAVSSEMLPADAADAIVGRVLDPSRRSIVVVVDAAHALDAFAFTSRFAKADDALEVTDAGQKLASFARRSIVNRDGESKPAELAMIAKALPVSSATSIQSELRRVDAGQADAFEITPPPTPADVEKTMEQQQVAGQGVMQQGVRLDATPTTQTTVRAPADGASQMPKAVAELQAGFATTIPADKDRARDVADLGAALHDAPQLIDLYVVVRQPATPASQPTSMPATATATAPTSQPTP